MKKYLIVLAAALVTLASCNNGGGSKYTSIKFKEAEITLGVGESQKLKVLYEPTSIEQAPVCVWSSSNEAVATVDSLGVVTAIAEGEANITAKHEELTAVCKAIVADPRSLYTWGGIARFSDQEPFEEGGELETYDVELSDGVYKCYYGKATYYFWDDGIALKNNSLAGEGYLFAMEVPCFVIAEEGDYKGASVGSPIYFIDEEFNPADTAYAYCVKAGALGDVNAWAEVVLEENHDLWDQCWKGPECVIFSDADGEGGFYYPSWPGILNKGYIYGNYQGMKRYDFSATWADGYYGLAIDESGKAPKEPYEWATATFPYVLQPNADAPAKVARKINTDNLKKAVMSNKMFKTTDKLVVKK